MNWSDHTIVDDEFLIVKDSSLRLWEHKIRGNHLPIHMISNSLTTQKEHVQKDVWNISIISIYGLFYHHQNTKHIFVEFPVTKDKKTSNNTNNSFWSALTSSVKMSMLKSCPSHVLVLFSNEVDGSNLTFSPLKSHCKVMASNKSSNNTVMRESVLVILWWITIPWNFPYQPCQPHKT